MGEHERQHGARNEPSITNDGHPSVSIVTPSCCPDQQGSSLDLTAFYSSSATRTGTRAARPVGTTEIASETAITKTTISAGRQLAPRRMTGNPVVFVR